MQKLITSYESNTPYSENYLTSRRAEKRHFPTIKVLAYGAAVIAAVGGHAGINKLTAPKPMTVIETVQPHQMAWNVAEEAMDDAGRSSGDIRPVADQIVKKYGTDLRVGQEIKVVFK